MEQCFICEEILYLQKNNDWLNIKIRITTLYMVVCVNHSLGNTHRQGSYNSQLYKQLLNK